MTIPFHHLGSEAEEVWQDYLDKCEADAAALRERREEIDE